MIRCELFVPSTCVHNFTRGLSRWNTLALNESVLFALIQCSCDLSAQPLNKKTYSRRRMALQFRRSPTCPTASGLPYPPTPLVQLLDNTGNLEVKCIVTDNTF